jgi:hypothetical protein
MLAGEFQQRSLFLKIFGLLLIVTCGSVSRKLYLTHTDAALNPRVFTKNLPKSSGANK